VAVDRKTGLLVSLKSGETELLDRPLGPHFWRAPIDNDRGNNMPTADLSKRGNPGLGAWREAPKTWELDQSTWPSRTPGASSSA